MCCTFIHVIKNNFKPPNFTLGSRNLQLWYGSPLVNISINSMLNSWEEKFKKIKRFHYMTYMTTPLHKNPCPGGHEVYYKLSRLFLGHHYYIYLFCLIHARGSRRHNSFSLYDSTTLSQETWNFTILVNPSWS